jgi:transposase
LREALVEAAKGTRRTKSYLGALYRRLAARRGANRAAVAVAHTILVIAYHLLTGKEKYRELGANYFDERERSAVPRRLVRRLEGLGLVVTVEPAPIAA